MRWSKYVFVSYQSVIRSRFPSSRMKRLLCTMNWATVWFTVHVTLYTPFIFNVICYMMKPFEVVEIFWWIILNSRGSYILGWMRNPTMLLFFYSFACSLEEPWSIIHPKNSTPLIIHHTKGFNHASKHMKNKRGVKCDTNSESPCRKRDNGMFTVSWDD